MTKRKNSVVKDEHIEPSDPPDIDVRRFLVEQGYLAAINASAEDVSEAIASYQAFHGLIPDGLAGPVTTRHMERPRLCGVPEMASDNPSQMRWSRSIADNLLWHPTSALPGFTISDTKDVYAHAWSLLAAICNINPRYHPNARTANVLHNVGRIDGPSGTLAWSKLAYLQAQQLDQLYDSGEPWSFEPDLSRPVPSGRIDAGAVACHEIGHVLGSGHLPAGNLLAPIYSSRIRSPQEGDIEVMVIRYGRPVHIPEPPLPPPLPPTPHPVPPPTDFTETEIWGGKYLHTPAIAGDDFSVGPRRR